MLCIYFTVRYMISYILFETSVGLPWAVAPLFPGDLPGALALASMGMEWLAPLGEVSELIILGAIGCSLNPRALCKWTAWLAKGSEPAYMQD